MIIQTGGTVSTGKNTTHLHQAGNIQVSVLLCCEHSPINLMIRVRFSRMHRKDAGTWGLPKKHLRNCMMNLKSWRFGVGFLRTSDFWDSKANLSPIWWVIPTRIWKTPGFLMGFLFIYWSLVDFWGLLKWEKHQDENGKIDPTEKRRVQKILDSKMGHDWYQILGPRRKQRSNKWCNTFFNKPICTQECEFARAQYKWIGKIPIYPTSNLATKKVVSSNIFNIFGF